MRMIVHFGETLPEELTPEHIISAGLLFVWAVAIFFGMLFCFGIGAATGDILSQALVNSFVLLRLHCCLPPWPNVLCFSHIGLCF